MINQIVISRGVINRAKRLEINLSLVLGLSTSLSLFPSSCLAQTYQFGWSISTSQGKGSSSAASQTVRSAAVNSGVLLINAEARTSPGSYTIIDPTQPFSVQQTTETSATVSNSSSSGFSTFTGLGTSVFHNPVNP